MYSQLYTTPLYVWSAGRDALISLTPASGARTTRTPARTGTPPACVVPVAGVRSAHAWQEGSAAHLKRRHDGSEQRRRRVRGPRGRQRAKRASCEASACATRVRLSGSSGRKVARKDAPCGQENSGGGEKHDWQHAVAKERAAAVQLQALGGERCHRSARTRKRGTAQRACAGPASRLTSQFSASMLSTDHPRM